MSKVTILLHPPECEVCGQHVDPKFLQPWNGKDVCKYCIQEINGESEQYVSNYQY